MRLLWLTALILVVDQVTKQWVVDTMFRGQSIPVLGDVLRLTYTENPGMAFGIRFGPEGMITVIALVAVGLIGWYMWRVRNGYWPYRLALAFIMGGALGNIIDRVFYGWLLYDGELFKGRVVDFIHVNLWTGFVPEWVPGWGGAHVALFPIWNVADMAIVAGVVGLLLFQNRFHEELEARFAAAQAAEEGYGADVEHHYDPEVDATTPPAHEPPAASDEEVTPDVSSERKP